MKARADNRAELTTRYVERMERCAALVETAREYMRRGYISRIIPEVFSAERTAGWTDAERRRVHHAVRLMIVQSRQLPSAEEFRGNPRMWIGRLWGKGEVHVTGNVEVREGGPLHREVVLSSEDFDGVTGRGNSLGVTNGALVVLRRGNDGGVHEGTVLHERAHVENTYRMVEQLGVRSKEPYVRVKDEILAHMAARKVVGMSMREWSECVVERLTREESAYEYWLEADIAEEERMDAIYTKAQAVLDGGGRPRAGELWREYFGLTERDAVSFEGVKDVLVAAQRVVEYVDAYFDGVQSRLDARKARIRAWVEEARVIVERYGEKADDVLAVTPMWKWGRIVAGGRGVRVVR